MKIVAKKNWALPIMAGILSLGLILSSCVVMMGIKKTKTAQNTITVTGSAKQQIRADLVTWKGTYYVQSQDLSEAYNLLNDNMKKVKNYLINKGIPEPEMVFSSISTTTNYVMQYNYQPTSKVESYKLTQYVNVSSKDVDKITVISRESTELINQGINFQSGSPQYTCTKIADLKVNMLGLATQDAKNRANQIAASTGSKVGVVRSANMGVFQITPLYSTEVSDYGINDTSSIDKEITAVVNCNFEIK